MQTPYRVGQTIYLRPLDAEKDAAVCVPWWNDPEVTRYTRRYFPMTLAGQVELFRTHEGSTTVCQMGIVRKEDDRLIGVMGLHEIDARHRNAWFGIVIGDPTVQGKGHGTEATRMILDLAFLTFNLHRVYLFVYEYNERARRVYEKVGFQVEGRLRQDCYWEGRYWDAILMGILREEWERTRTQAG